MIYVTGDTHGPIPYGSFSVDGYSRRFNTANFPEQKEMGKEDYVIVCGDFGGAWNFAMESKEETYWLDWLDAKPFTTLFVPGNHENYDRLTGIQDPSFLDGWLYDNVREKSGFTTLGYPQADWHGGKVRKLRDTVLMLERGYVFVIDSARCFCFGGARSHDIDGGILDPSDYPDKKSYQKAYDSWQERGELFRVKGVSWWEQEMPTAEEMSLGRESLEQNDWNVDFVFTHDCPSSDKVLLGHRGTDELNRYLEEIRQRLTYKRWFFGHMHDNRQVNAQDILLYEQIIRIR